MLSNQPTKGKVKRKIHSSEFNSTHANIFKLPKRKLATHYANKSICQQQISPQNPYRFSSKFEQRSLQCKNNAYVKIG